VIRCCFELCDPPQCVMAHSSGRASAGLLLACLSVCAVVTLLSGENATQGSLLESTSTSRPQSIPPLVESDAVSRMAMHSQVEAALSDLSTEIAGADDASNYSSFERQGLSRVAVPQSAPEIRSVKPTPQAVAQQVEAVKLAVRKQRRAREKMRRYAALVRHTELRGDHLADRYSGIDNAGDALIDTTSQMQRNAVQLQQLGERDSLKQQLRAEHTRFLQEKAKVQQVRQRAAATVRKVQAQVLHMAKVAAASIKNRALHLARSAARAEAHRWASKAQGVVKESDSVLLQGHSDIKLGPDSAKKALLVAKRALRQVNRAMAVQARTQQQLKHTQAQERKLGAAVSKQQVENGKLAAHTDHIKAALRQDLKKATAKELPTRRRNRELAALVQAERQKAEAQVHALQVRLQVEHDRRVQAEATAAAVVGGPANKLMAGRKITHAALVATTKVVDDIAVAPEQPQKKRKNSRQSSKLAAAQVAVRAARDAMRKARAMSQEATTSATLARTEARAEDVAAGARKLPLLT